ncbi:hypothetical protein HDU67_010217 [Dinochytrium kinnereticum]|nr:hypothetical protein HDU67_010217 [Dinochytrium kinnereticum]
MAPSVSLLPSTLNASLAAAAEKASVDVKKKADANAVRVIVATGNDLELLSVGAYRAIVNASLVIADASVSTDILGVVSGDLVLLAPNRPLSQPVHAAIHRAIDLGHAVVRIKLDATVTDDAGYASKAVPQVNQPTSKPDSPATLYEGHVISPTDDAELRSFKLPAAVSATISAQKASLPAVSKVHGLVSGEQAAAHVAYALTDMSFVYAVTPEFAPKNVLTKWAEEGLRNGYGRTHDVNVMSTQAGAGSIVHGAVAAGASASVVASSLALKHMVPTLHQVAASHLPLVLHVSSQAIDLVGTPGAAAASFADVIATAQAAPGLAVLASATVQEVHDFAVVAHVAAAAARVPVVHFFDATRTASEKAKVATIEAKGLASVQDALLHDDSVKNLPVADVVENVMTVLEPVLGVRYRLFEYSGPRDAESVVIALGPTASLIEGSIQRSKGVGLLKVRLLRPWSATHLIQALPTTIRRVAVIDETRTGVQGQLFLDVTSAFYSATTGRPIPIIVSGDFAKGAEHFQPSAADAFVAHLAAGKVNFGFSIEAPAGGVEHQYRDDHVNEAIFWDVQADGTGSVAEDVARVVDHAGFDLVQSIVVRDDIQVEPVAASHLRFGKCEISAAAASGVIVTSADFVAVHNVAVLGSYDVVSSIRTGGVLLINLPGAAASLDASLPDIERLLSASARTQIVQRGIRLHVIDAAKVASNYTLFEGNPTEYIHLVLKACFLKLCRGIDTDKAVAGVLTGLDGSETSHNVLRTKVGAFKTALRTVSIRINVPASWTLSFDADEAAAPIVPRGTMALKKVHQRSDEDEAEVAIRSVKRHAPALPVMFKEAFGVRKVLRPDVPEKTFVVKVTENRRLTPETYERNVFHIEMDTAGTGLKYEIGEALGVYGHNDAEEVQKFLELYGLNGDEVVSYERRSEEGDLSTEYRTLEQLFVQVADLFGKPGKKFYQSLVEHATVMSERERLGWLGSSEGADDLQKLTEEETPTYADVFRMFPSARPTVDTLLALIPDIKPRHYSISSSMNVHPTSVHLLVVVVDWKTKSGITRTGQCTRFLNSLRPGQSLTVSVKPSVMKLPPSHEQPVIMSGLGTGMAPFRAFVEERAYQKSLGKKVGPMVLYFGARHRSEEYLYGEELEAYHADGLLTHLRLAFSRDQKEKVYIQHKIQADAEMLAEMILEREGAFYLCGPTWPVPDVKEALVGAFRKRMSEEEAEERLEGLKEEERYVLEVY